MLGDVLLFDDKHNSIFPFLDLIKKFRPKMSFYSQIKKNDAIDYVN